MKSILRFNHLCKEAILSTTVSPNTSRRSFQSRSRRHHFSSLTQSFIETHTHDNKPTTISTLYQNGAFPNSTPEPTFSPSTKSTPMNLMSTINQTLHTALSTDSNSILFGQDIAFGGVFRCTTNLQSTFGSHRVFNTPLSELGIVGLAIGYASTGHTAIAEIQFADYVYPAYDLIMNEMSKFRYRSGNQWECGGVTLRMPCGAVGHGGHYHSQSPEGVLSACSGVVVVMPRGPRSAKGLLLSAIRSKDPVIFLEPKALYRASVESVPDHDYEIPLGKAEILQHGSDITLIGYGTQLRTLLKASTIASTQYNISVEVIDLRTIHPMDVYTISHSVKKTGKCIVSHEAPITMGISAEICAVIQELCFEYLEAPIGRVCGYDTPFPLVFERFYVPDEFKVLDEILKVVEYAK